MSTVDPDEQIDGISAADQRTAFCMGQLFWCVRALHTVVSGDCGTNTIVERMMPYVRSHPVLAYGETLGQAHVILSKLRDRRPALYESYAERIDELVSLIDTAHFESGLTPLAGMAFWLGYSDERRRMRAAKTLP